MFDALPSWLGPKPGHDGRVNVNGRWNYTDFRATTVTARDITVTARNTTATARNTTVTARDTTVTARDTTVIARLVRAISRPDQPARTQRASSNCQEGLRPPVRNLSGPDRPSANNCQAAAPTGTPGSQASTGVLGNSPVISLETIPRSVSPSANRTSARRNGFASSVMSGFSSNSATAFAKRR